MSFAHTKIQQPRPRAGLLLPRPALERDLAVALGEQRAVLLCAPAGYGKTALLTRALQHCPSAMRWPGSRSMRGAARVAAACADQPAARDWDCHTPLKMGPNGPEPDLSRLLSGHPEGLQMPPAPVLPEGPWLVTVAATNTAWAGPWGVSYTANLTPDVDTGLGAWTVRDSKATIRTGRLMGRGRAVLPPMPIPVYNNFSDDDLEAVFAYLRTIPPVKNRVPEPQAPRPAATATR